MVGDGFDTAVGVGEFSDREVASNAVVDALEGCVIGAESADQGAWREIQPSCGVVEAAVTVWIEQRLANSQRECVFSQAVKIQSLGARIRNSYISVLVRVIGRRPSAW